MLKIVPIKLDEIDITILESLVKDGRKSFNQVARETKISAPTVKARYNRLINAGLIKAVTLDLDVGKIEAKTGKRLDSLKEKTIKHNDIQFGKGAIIELPCEYCKDSIDGKPHVLKFGNFERFFCCTSCRALYKEKYKTRIKVLE